jgi:hypothetical protein
MFVQCAPDQRRNRAVANRHEEGYVTPLNRPCRLDCQMRIPVHREHSFRFNVNARSADAEHRF